MPDTGYTPSARLAAGDPALRDGPAANVPIDREALDARRYVRGATWGQLIWSGRYEVSGTAAAPVVKVGTIEAVTLCDGNGTSTGTWRPYFTSGQSALGASHVEGGGSLANSTIYHLYVFNDGTSTLAFQISATPPTTSGAPTVQLLWKRNETCNYRYLGSFTTDASGKPLPGFSVNGRFTFRSSACGGSDYVLGSASTTGRATSWTTVSLAALMPAHARIARLRCYVSRASGDPGAVGLEMRTTGDTTGLEVAHATLSSSVDTRALSEVTIAAPAQSIDYQLGAAVTNSNPYGARIALLGWE